MAKSTSQGAKPRIHGYDHLKRPSKHGVPIKKRATAPGVAAMLPQVQPFKQLSAVMSRTVMTPLLAVVLTLLSYWWITCG